MRCECCGAPGAKPDAYQVVCDSFEGMRPRFLCRIELAAECYARKLEIIRSCLVTFDDDDPMLVPPEWSWPTRKEFNAWRAQRYAMTPEGDALLRAWGERLYAGEPPWGIDGT